LLEVSALSGKVTNLHSLGSAISANCHGFVLSITSSTVLGFSMLLFKGSTPFLNNSKKKKISLNHLYSTIMLEINKKQYPWEKKRSYTGQSLKTRANFLHGWLCSPSKERIKQTSCPACRGTWWLRQSTL